MNRLLFDPASVLCHSRPESKEPILQDFDPHFPALFFFLSFSFLFLSCFFFPQPLFMPRSTAVAVCIVIQRINQQGHVHKSPRESPVVEPEIFCICLESCGFQNGRYAAARSSRKPPIISTVILFPKYPYVLQPRQWKLRHFLRICVCVRLCHVVSVRSSLIGTKPCLLSPRKMQGGA